MAKVRGWPVSQVQAGEGPHTRSRALPGMFRREAGLPTHSSVGRSQSRTGRAWRLKRDID